MIISLQEELLHADETGLQVLNEPGKTTQVKSYMWLYRTSGISEKPIVLFDYRADRLKENLKDFLKAYKGYLHTDGYAGYESLENVELAGCWAHVCWKFAEALKAHHQALPDSRLPKKDSISVTNYSRLNTKSKIRTQKSG